MLDSTVRRTFASPLDAIAGPLTRAGVTANMVTVAGFVLGLIGVACVAANALVLGLVFLTLNRLADGLDGTLARQSGETQLGAFLDSALTYIVYSALAFAFIVARQQYGLAGAFLQLSLMAVAATDLGTRAYFAGGERGAADAERSALVVVEKSEIYLFYLVVLLVDLIFAYAPFLFGVLCFISAGARIASATSITGVKAKS